jgi:hypothetical protein
MPRITLYVPDDLKARMDQSGDDLNWSAITQRAIRGAIITLTLKRNPTDMNAVIERLRASKQLADEANNLSGKECGAAWARETAEYDQLHRVWGALLAAAEIDVSSLHRLIDPENELDRAEWQEFWECHAGGATLTDAFAAGFAEGANEVFEEVKDKL